MKKLAVTSKKRAPAKKTPLFRSNSFLFRHGCDENGGLFVKSCLQELVALPSADLAQMAFEMAKRPLASRAPGAWDVGLRALHWTLRGRGDALALLDERSKVCGGRIPKRSLNEKAVIYGMRLYEK